MRAEDVLGRVILVTGKEEFLGARTVEEVRAVVRAHDAESELSEAAASDLTLATLGELAAPSLFSSVRCVVVRGFEDLPDESVDGLLGYAAEPADDVAWCSCTAEDPKGSGVLAKLRKLATVTEVKSGEIKAWEMSGFAVSEARRRGADPRQAGRRGARGRGGPRPPVTRCRRRPAHQRLPRRADRRGEGRSLLRRSCRGQELRDRRRDARRRPGPCAPGAAVVHRERHLRGLHPLRGRGAAALPGQPRGGQPRRRDAAVEDEEPQRPGPWLEPARRWRARSAPWRRRTPTSRERRATRRTRSSASC